ncbi:MAG: AmmeMemoRadiSam system radical SAM enzyme [Desulfosalsimonadaceae bacterium]
MEALLYERIKDNVVQCGLCNHRCVIKNGRRGKCSVRENNNGILETLVYDKIIARNIDPIEKKPLFHFYPGSLSYSIGTVGCNFRCRFCQNADIAHMATDHSGRIMGQPFTPEQMVDEALQAGCTSISYTYTEPTVFFELARNTAERAHERGLKNVFVTNGYMTTAALEMIAPYLDAANVDLKAFTEEFYETQCSATLAPVLESLRTMKKLGIFVEVTTLLIPGLNDSSGELESLAGFIASELGDQTPWHVSRFHPTYRLTDRPPTSPSKLMEARQIGIDKGLAYVYTGNMSGRGAENTSCPGCGNDVIVRSGFTVLENRISHNRCRNCGAHIHGVGLGEL